MDDQVPEEVKRVRLQTLMDVQNEISYELNKPMEGQVFDIIVEGQVLVMKICGLVVHQAIKWYYSRKTILYQLAKLYLHILIKHKLGFATVQYKRGKYGKKANTYDGAVFRY